ncbi:MAG: purine-nucleoside phosphorylase [Candidatus Cloacimonetes bacterium]|nr:purine-nucleoside phosphorylase [Candidatus Cloacimonadota bacterium]MBL7086228.1 purine-nucleoside phosphorylase [Candidatus Cloacimonadota bacterium]
MKKILKYLPDTVNFIKSQYTRTVDTAIILGTGLNEIASSIDTELVVPYNKIPNFKPSTAPSHKGQLIFGTMAGRGIVLMQGRLHCYEGYSPLEVAYPIFALKEIGVKNLIITNASGSLNQNFQLGDIILITDHINLTGMNPLRGQNEPMLGPKFPSMHDAYHKRFIEIMKNIAQENNIPIRTGIYAGFLGPNLETPAECKMLKIIGADMVGLSTVHEVIVGVYLQMKILGISTITNISNLYHSRVHTQSEIEKTAFKAQDKIKILLQNFVKQL